jgi:TPR repeat protein
MFKILLIVALLLGSAPLQAPIANANNLEGVESNPEFNILQQKAEQGDKEAQALLGGMYYYGKGVTKDYKKAFVWSTKGANQGVAMAQALLGLMYFHEQGVTRNYVEAYKWFNIAASQGQENANIARDELETIMTPVQIAEGQEKAAAWQPKK